MNSMTYDRFPQVRLAEVYSQQQIIDQIIRWKVKEERLKIINFEFVHSPWLDRRFILELSSTVEPYMVEPYRTYMVVANNQTG